MCAWQELSNREQMMQKMETSLENYRRKFAVMRHQQGILYQEYADKKKVCCSKPLSQCWSLHFTVFVALTLLTEWWEGHLVHKNNLGHLSLNILRFMDHILYSSFSRMFIVQLSSTNKYSLLVSHLSSAVCTMLFCHVFAELGLWNEGTQRSADRVSWQAGGRWC